MIGIHSSSYATSTFKFFFISTFFIQILSRTFDKTLLIQITFSFHLDQIQTNVGKTLIPSQSNQITVVAFQSVQLAQASFLQKNQMLQNGFLIAATLRWHRASVA